MLVVVVSISMALRSYLDAEVLNFRRSRLSLLFAAKI